MVAVMGKPSCGDPPVSSNSDPVFCFVCWMYRFQFVRALIERREVLVVVLATKEKRLHITFNKANNNFLHVCNFFLPVDEIANTMDDANRIGDGKSIGYDVVSSSTAVEEEETTASSSFFCDEMVSSATAVCTN